MNIFKIDKFPYLLTILFALSAWSLSKIVDDLESSSILEYKLSQSRTNGDSSVVYYELTNITKRNFKKLSLKLSYFKSADGKIYAANILTEPPADKDSISFENDEKNMEFAKFFISQMQPGWRYILEVRFTGPTQPVLHYYSDINETVNLKEYGFETFLVRHENLIIVILLICWIILIVVYCIIISRDVSPEFNIEDYEYQI